MTRTGLFTFEKTPITVSDLTDQGTDLEFWLSRTPEERLSAVEFMRQMMYDYNPATDRMERILEVDDLKSR
jgi:hypothetical protein